VRRRSALFEGMVSGAGMLNAERSSSDTAASEAAVLKTAVFEVAPGGTETDCAAMIAAF